MRLIADRYVTYHFPGGTIHLSHEQAVEVPTERGKRILAKIPHVRIVEPTPPGQHQPPLQPGWLIAWRDEADRFHGGGIAPQRGTVARVDAAHGWIVTLTDGTQVPAQKIVSVARTGSDGRVTAAWTVREHGLSGTGRD